MSDLRHFLKLDVRCGNGSTVQQQQAAVALIALLTGIYPQFSDWKELVKSDGQSDVQKSMKEHADFVMAEKMPELGGLILAPEGTQPTTRRHDGSKSSLQHRTNKTYVYPQQ